MIKNSSDNALEFTYEFDIHSIMSELPANLKSKLLMFLFREAIEAVPFLQNRDEHFYLTYLERLQHVKFKEGTEIIKPGTSVDEVYMILSGDIINAASQRIF